MLEQKINGFIDMYLQLQSSSFLHAVTLQPQRADIPIFNCRPVELRCQVEICKYLAVYVRSYK